MVSIPGTWTLSYSWFCSTSYSNVPLTFNADGTWSGGGSTGKWVVVEGLFIQNYNSSNTTYTGTVTGNVIAGVMTNFLGSTGCWYMKKSGVIGAKVSASAALDQAGNKKGGSKKAAGKKSGTKKKR